MPESSYSSGMHDSFKSVVPGSKPPSQANSQVTPPVKPTPTSSFSKPVSAVPTAGQSVATTSGVAAVSPATTKPAAPSSPASGAPTKFNMNLGNILKLVGPAVTTGKSIAGAIPKDFLGQAKWHLGDPNNFANMVGALSPITEPLMRTAGMPLMMGAYSMLRDPNYAKDLTNGFNFKRGALAAPAAPAKPAPPAPPAFDKAFDFQPPTGLGTVVSSGPSIAANEAVRAPFRLPTGGGKAEDLTRLGLAAGGMAAGTAATKIPGAAGRALAGPVLNIGLDAANVAGLPEAMAGKPAPTWEEIARRHESAMNPVHWAQGYKEIADSHSGPVSKALQAGVHTAFGNPLAQIAFNPVSTGVTALQNIREGANAVDEVNSLNPYYERAREARLRQIMQRLGK